MDRGRMVNHFSTLRPCERLGRKSSQEASQRFLSPQNLRLTREDSQELELQPR